MATVADILEPHSPAVRELAETLRELIKELVPNVREKAYPGWHGIGYHSANGYFCAIFPFADHVRLLFEHGVDLHDPDGLLEGTTKQTRYIPIHALTDIHRDAVTALILAAAG
jgi:hypothetical protein